MRSSHLLLALPLLAASLGGCVSARKAIPYASSRSGCDSKDIEVVSQDGHEMVLSVCGTHENWSWNAFSGWEYGGLAGQPGPAVKDTDNDGIADGEDACPTLAGPANLTDRSKHGCPPPQDSDGDGVTDDIDACPNDKGAPSTDRATTGCPDQDADGIVDKLDACKEVPGVTNPDPAKNGCPPDADGDGVLDSDDACPDTPGPKSEDPAKNGCPDRDGDGIIDDKDACIEIPGVANDDPAKNGCPPGKPKRVVLMKDKIQINEKIQFAVRKSVILPASYPLLAEIIEVIQRNPQVKKLQIEGHASSDGDDAYNMQLSDARAKSVMAYMIGKGVDASRLTAVGFGETKPIADNATATGREQNRRVEFNIVEQERVAIPQPEEPTPTPPAPPTP